MDDYFAANFARDGSNYLPDSSVARSNPENGHAKKSSSPMNMPNQDSFSPPRPTSSSATANLELPFCASDNMYSPAFSFQDDTPEWSSDHQFSNAGSTQATPNLEDDLFATAFLPMEDPNGLQDPCSAPQGPFVTQASSSPANGNLQPPVFRPIHHGHQLMSPCTTNHSSPRSSSEFVNFASRAPPTSFPCVQLDNAWAPQQQHTPARTDSPGQGSNGVLEEYSASIISPEIHVESCSRANSPSGSEILGKKSHGPRTSGSFLSPHDAEATSDEATSDEESQNGAIHTQRDDDGSWMRNSTSGLAGIGPDERNNLNDALMPSINEMEKLRIADEKKDEVQKWLTDTDKPGDRDDTGHTFNVESKFSNPESNTCEPLDSPAAEVEVKDGKEEESYFPRVPRVDTAGSQPHRVQPWHDPPRPPTWGNKYQPDTSNAAMQRFLDRARDIDAASVTATISSFRTRRKSESEIASIRSSGGLSKEISTVNRPRKSSILNTFAKRTPSLLRKKSPPTAGPTHSLSLDTKTSGVKRSGSWSRPKSPKVDNRPNHSRGSGSHGDNLFPTISRGIREAISRSRSPSQTNPGLSELMIGVGGPPMLSLPPDSPHDADSDASDVDEHAPAEVDQLVVPTVDGFLQHAVEVCKGRDSTFQYEVFIVKRAAELQHRRYQHLLEQKAQHLRRVRNKNCSRAFCTGLGGQPKVLPIRAGKDGKVASSGFRILSPSDDEGDDLNEGGTVQVSRLEKGFPLPPIKRLPAEFECPFCFEVKHFSKPSDWTQHLRDDVQPYFCTFRDCDSVKTWGRKADWKRHMEERHLQLETFKCNWRDCGKEVVRKSNFYAHCLREHRVPVPNHEPKTKEFKDTVAKVRAGHRFEFLTSWENGVADFSGPGDHTTKFWLIVHACRQEKTSRPEDQPCPFCSVCSASWKSFYAHLARHMEMLSMPIPRLVQSKDVDADADLASPVVESTQRRRAKSAVTPHSSNMMAGGGMDHLPVVDFNDPAGNLQFYTDWGATSTALGTSMSPQPNTMTYPPLQIASPRSHPPLVAQQQHQAPPVLPASSTYAVDSFANQPWSFSNTAAAVPRSTPTPMANNNGFYTTAQNQGHHHHQHPPAAAPVRPSLTTSVYASSGQVYQSPIEGPPESFGAGADLPTGLYADNSGVFDGVDAAAASSSALPLEFAQQQQQAGYDFDFGCVDGGYARQQQKQRRRQQGFYP
ncbi:uncharacterized protein BKA78DRAFT_47768 [Phyllosticta capitalensis]|uniref:uncharacterized protein n=1 Tax=Phyllosticta capitalensis TaxID=121624 RepID=UPI0031307FBD